MSGEGEGGAPGDGQGLVRVRVGVKVRVRVRVARLAMVLLGSTSKRPSEPMTRYLMSGVTWLVSGYVGE